MGGRRANSGRSDTGRLFDPPRNCGEVVHAGRMSVLVDAEALFREFTAAAGQAERTLFILGWDFDSRWPRACSEPS